MLVPKLRFKREDGTEYPEWGNKSFANAFAPLNNNTFSRDMLSENGTVLNIHYGDILVKFGEVCDIQAMDIPKVNAEIDTSKYDELQDGDIILADTAEDETVGKAIEIYHTGTSKVVSGLHTMACRPNDKYAPKYMGYYINSPTYHNQLLPYMQGIKVTSIGRKNIADTVIYYPADLEEQQKIANFLSTVDEVIAQSESEVQNLEQQKKAAMQKIFSQEVRFKREDGTDYPEWEEKALSDISEFITKGTTPKKYSENGGVNFVQINSIVDGAINTDKCLRIDEETHNGFLSRSVLFENDILCSIAGALGVIAVVNKDVLPANTNQALAIIRLNEGCNHRYIAFALSSYVMEKYIKQCKTVGAQPNLSLAQIRDMIVPFPCLKEQQKIADFLSAYDEAISYAKQELDKWKELKKGLLQQMLV